MNTYKDTYRAECVCGAIVESQSKRPTCHQCGRELVFRWGSAPEVFKDGKGHRQAEKEAGA